VILFFLVTAITMGTATNLFAETPKKGGQLVVAMEGEPPNLDMGPSGLNLLRYIAYHVMEQLFVLDKKFRPTPLLAEGYSVSADGKVYTIKLRKGVKFHNGQEMAAEDAVASLQRWVKVSRVAKKVDYNIIGFRVKDKYSLELELKEPMGFIITALAVFRNGAVIYPKSIVEATELKAPVTQIIGTGPYRFEEWKKGEYVLLKRYDGYSTLPGEPNGYGGRRTAYLDEIKFIFVSEPSVRALGIQAGDFHFAYPISIDDYDRLKKDPNVESLRSAPLILMLWLNKAEGPLTNVGVRRAMLAAIDGKEIMDGVMGNPNFYRLDPGIMWKETAWWTDIGKDRYNQADPEKAKKLLKEAGYKGEEIRFVVSSPEKLMMDTSLIAQQQLEKAGFNIKMVYYDVATHRETIQSTSRWEVTSMDSTYRTHPILHVHIDPKGTGWWKNEKKDALVKDLMAEVDPDKALEIWKQIEEIYYEDVPVVKIGDFFWYLIKRKELKGYANLPEPFFWNAWLDK
jgi:peptide/nickel transport system substrate-binding protein